LQCPRQAKRLEELWLEADQVEAGSAAVFISQHYLKDSSYTNEHPSLLITDSEIFDGNDLNVRQRRGETPGSFYSGYSG
jgi:hypothetical protein